MVSMYAFPNERRVRLWDFPGAGTPDFPFETYISRMGLRYLDRVLVVNAGRFTETELALCKELQAHGVPHCMVRTKADMDVWNNQLDNGSSPAQTVAEIVEDLKNYGVPQPFVVSLRDTNSYDFAALLSEVLPWLRPKLFGASLGEGWDDAWAMPSVLSQVSSSIQGQWCDIQGTTYYVQGLDVHVQRSSGRSGVVNLSESDDGKVWWLDRLSIDAGAISHSLYSSELHWKTKWIGSALKPMIWRRCE